MSTALENDEKARCFLDKRVVKVRIEQKFAGVIMSKDNDVYRFIVRYKIAHQGNSPSFSEIMESCQISSKSVVSDILASLEDAGLLKQDGVKNIEVRNGKWILEEA